MKLSEKGKFGTGLTLGVPVGGAVAGEFFIHWQSLIKQMPRGITFNTVYVLRQPVDSARNIIAKNAVEHKSKYVIMCDDDTLVPFFSVRRMLELADRYDYDAIVAPSWPKAAFTRPTIYDSVETPGLIDWNYGDVFEVYMAGFPFVLLRVSALELMKDFLNKKYGEGERDWFFSGKWEAAREGFKPQPYEGAEDFHFWYHWQEAGLRLICDTWCCTDHVDRNSGRMFPTPDVIDSMVRDEFKGKRFFQIPFPMDATKEGVEIATPPIIKEKPIEVISNVKDEIEYQDDVTKGEGS